MTYQSEKQFAPNRLAEEVQAVAEQGAATAALSTPLRTAASAPPLPNQPAPAAELPAEQPRTEVIKKIEAAAADALRNTGAPTNFQALENLISP